MSTNLNTFIIALQNCEDDIIHSRRWEVEEVLAVALAYQAYTMAERLDAKLGRIADALETLARNEAPASLALEDEQ